MSESVAKIRISADDREVVASAKRMGDAFDGAAGKAGKIGSELQTTLGRILKIAAGVQAVSNAMQEANNRARALNTSAEALAKTSIDINRAIAVAAQRTGMSSSQQADMRSVAAAAADQGAAVKAIDDVAAGKVRGNATEYVRAAGTGLFQADEMERARRFGISRDDVVNRIAAMPDDVRRDFAIRQGERSRAAFEVSEAGDPAAMAHVSARADEIRRRRKQGALSAVGDAIEGLPVVGPLVRARNDKSDLSEAMSQLIAESVRVQREISTNTRRQINYGARE